MVRLVPTKIDCPYCHAKLRRPEYRTPNGSSGRVVLLVKGPDADPNFQHFLIQAAPPGVVPLQCADPDCLAMFSVLEERLSE